MITPKIDRLVTEIYEHVNHDPDITENIFVYIESSNHYLPLYNDLVREHGRETVNKIIGRRVKVLYDLPNTGKKVAKRTKLIKSYTKH